MPSPLVDKPLYSLELGMAICRALDKFHDGPPAEHREGYVPPSPEILAAIDLVLRLVCLELPTAANTPSEG